MSTQPTEASVGTVETKAEPPKTEPPKTEPPKTEPPASNDDANDDANDDDDDDASWLGGWTGTRRRMGVYNEVGAFVGNVGNLGLSGRSHQSFQTGFRIYEHHGLLSKFSMGALAAMATSGDRVETGRTVERSGNVVTTTVYSRRKTDAEHEADRRMVEAAVEGEYVTELQVYTDGFFGVAAGKAERIRGLDLYMGGNWIGPFVGELPSIFDVGLVYSYNHARNVLFNDGQRADIKFINVGVMVRYQLPLTEYLELIAQVDLNVYGLFADKDEHVVMGTPIRLGAYLNLTDRFYAKPTLTYTTGTTGIGKVVEAGVRF